MKKDTISTKLTSIQPVAPSGLRIKSGVKSGCLAAANHNESQLRIKSAVKAGTIRIQHNESLLAAPPRST